MVMLSVSPTLSVCSECSPAPSRMCGGVERAVCVRCRRLFLLPVTMLIPSREHGAPLEFPTVAMPIVKTGARRQIAAVLFSLLLNASILLCLALLYFQIAPSDFSPLNATFSKDGADVFSVDAIVEPGGAQQSKTPADSFMASVSVQTVSSLGGNDGLPAGVLGMGSGEGSGSGSGVGMFDGIETASTIAYVVDASGSMEGDRMKRVLRQLENSITALHDDQKFFVVFFNERTYPMMWPRSEIRLIHAHQENKTRVVKWAKMVAPEEATMPQRALGMALKLKPAVIFLLTDGDIPSTCIRMVRLSGSGSCIHTICVGDEGDTGVLKKIASISGGHLRMAP